MPRHALLSVNAFKTTGDAVKKRSAMWMLSASLAAPVRLKYSASALLSAMDFCVLL